MSLFLCVKPKMSDYEGNLICWPFMGATASLVNSCLFLRERNTAIFHSQILCACLFLALVLWAGEPGLMLRHPCFSGGTPTLAAEITLWNLRCCLWKRDQTFSHLCHSYGSQYGFCKSLIVMLLFSYSSLGYSGWLFYNLVVISVWSWKEVNVAFTYSATILAIP